MNLLHVAAEAFPLVKTGGLADVAAALPAAQRAQGHDARLLLPGYPAVVEGLRDAKELCSFGPAFGAARVRLVCGTMPDSGLPVYALDAPYRFARRAGPYQDAHGRDWSDNLQRYALFGWAAAQLAAGELDPGWRADVLHAHDWHAGLACAYLHAHDAGDTASVFTVHNLAFQGRFALADFTLLGLPSAYARPEGIEFHGSLCFMKAGLQLADRVTTVSPSYAREIGTPEFGCGMEGVVRARGADVSGILNGIDAQLWNPATDAALPAHFDSNDLRGKQACKRALQQSMGLAQDAAAPLLCVVSRLTGQKGMDLLIEALPALLSAGGQLALLGAGDPPLEQALQAAAASQPERVAVRIGYDEALAHRLIAGADMICVPSRFEPCGLTQLYALRYGTLPVVRCVGGLADTVQDADDPHAQPGTGWLFDAPQAHALAQSLQRAAAVYRDAPRWQRMQQAAMQRDNSWASAAAAYQSVYEAARERMRRQRYADLPPARTAQTLT